MSTRSRWGRLVTGPVESVAHALTRPSLSGRHRPLYPLNLVDRISGRVLTDAVKGKVVLITGASSGIGAATARMVGAAGGTVVLVARSADKLVAIAAEIEEAGGVAHVYPCDLSDLDDVIRLANVVQQELGRVDILVNNAGRSIRRSLKLSYDRMHDYQRTMQLNYFAPVQLMLELLPGMRERGTGHVINVSSAGVQTRVPRFGAYIASKAALDTLCDAWQAETHPDGVHFTTVHMALVRTPMIEATTLYDRFPALTPEDAAAVLCDAMVHRPRRVSPTFGQMAAFADAVSPQWMDRVRSSGFRLFDDSRAAQGDQSVGTDAEPSPSARLLASLTRGTHW